MVVRPPPLAFLLGLAEAGELWLLLRALYVLRVAPKAWEEERDKQLRDARWSKGLKKYKFKQLLSDASLWLVLGDNNIEAMIGIYVDDIIAAGPRKMVDEVLDLIGQIWSASETEVLQFGAAGRKFTFLGVCIVSVAGGYHIHQREYIKDLLKEWGLQEAKGSENLKEESAQYVPKEAAS